MSSTLRITVQTIVDAPLNIVWNCWTAPEHITQWNAASPDWHTPRATVDLRTGGVFCSRMEAKDGSMGFDFEGTYTNVVPHQLLEYSFGDRSATVTFQETEEGIQVVETFDAEMENPVEMQQQGWQAILDNFKVYTEAQ